MSYRQTCDEEVCGIQPKWLLIPNKLRFIKIHFSYQCISIALLSLSENGVFTTYNWSVPLSVENQLIRTRVCLGTSIKIYETCTYHTIVYFVTSKYIFWCVRIKKWSLGLCTIHRALLALCRQEHNWLLGGRFGVEASNLEADLFQNELFT